MRWARAAKSLRHALFNSSARAATAAAPAPTAGARAVGGGVSRGGRCSFHTSAAAAGESCPLPDQIWDNGRLLRKPEEPDPDDCCGRGCVECIWTIYTKQLQDYQARVAVIRGFEPPEDPFEALERRLAAQTSKLKDSDAQAL